MYRKMSLEERWRITEELMTLPWKALLQSYEEREHRLAGAREEHVKSCDALAKRAGMTELPIEGILGRFLTLVEAKAIPSNLPQEVG